MHLHGGVDCHDVFLLIVALMRFTGQSCRASRPMRRECFSGCSADVGATAAMFFHHDHDHRRPGSTTAAGSMSAARLALAGRAAITMRWSTLVVLIARLGRRQSRSRSG